MFRHSRMELTRCLVILHVPSRGTTERFCILIRAIRSTDRVQRGFEAVGSVSASVVDGELMVPTILADAAGTGQPVTMA